jgi:hypothetical protein
MQGLDAMIVRDPHRAFELSQAATQGALRELVEYHRTRRVVQV